jgi:hypothetical protein
MEIGKYGEYCNLVGNLIGNIQLITVMYAAVKLLKKRHVKL